MSARKISRREFLQGVGAGGAALTAAWILDGSVYASAGQAGPSWGMLIDVTRCSGCNSCALACKESNGLPNPDTVPNVLDTDAYTFVEERLIRTVDGVAERRYVKRQCMRFCLSGSGHVQSRWGRCRLSCLSVPRLSLLPGGLSLCDSALQLERSHHSRD